MKLIKAFLMLTILIPSLAISQNSKKKVGENFLISNAQKLELSNSDITNVIITDMFTTKHNGVTHIYYQQARENIPVFNATLNVNITTEDEILFHSNQFIANLDQSINTSKSVLDAEFAIKAIAQKLGYQFNEELVQLKNTGDQITFAETSYSKGKINVKKVYFPVNKNDVRLAWDVSLTEVNTPNIWNSQIDAVTGAVLSHENRTIFCQHEHGQYHNHTAECRHNNTNSDEIENQEKVLESMMMGDTYRVYPLPIESPIHGAHQLVTDPHFPAASPFGWHDFDGVEGPESVITRGNNVHAFQNEDASGFSSGDEPSGVPNDPNSTALVFDYPHNQDAEPEESVDADVVNLFYMNNMMHDITYVAGFDEVAGNYQLNNYGNGGRDNDFVNAYALDGTLIGGALTAVNNAYFGPSSDGNIGTMGMFRWNLPAAGLFAIDAPSELAGSVPNGTGNGGWGFDESYQSFDITAEMVQAFDGSVQFGDNVCGEVINPDEVNGKIAMIYRGLCEFGTKALNAQNAGAVAAIICNVPGAGNDPTSDGNTPMGMAAGSDGGQVTIPTFSLGFSDCNRIVASLNQGVSVTGTIRLTESTGPDQHSSGFDNGVIAHEYGHGISARLTGGASAVNCLRNDEQMGEGWSDFFALITTVEPGDEGTDARGIGNYVDGTSVDGRGIRRSPYSTDRTINNQTLKDIKATTAPHPLGEIWAVTLWDLYWAYVEKYGWNADWNDTESGNFRVLQLVMDGMKMQGCNPGFLRGRDGILAADRANTGGENQCLIWDVFAARGMGYFADGGDEDNRNDNSENFDPLPECQKTLKIYKSVPTIIAVNAEIDVELIVANHKDETVDAVVSDLIPEGMSFVAGSSNMAETIMSNQIFFNIDNFESGDWDTIRYRLIHDNIINSDIIFSNTVETSDEIGEWERELIQGETNIFRINASSTFPNFSGENGWLIEELDDNTEASIRFNDVNVTGELPVLRFWHRINTAFTRNGGFVEVSTDGIIWENAEDLYIRNGPDCPIQFTTFAIPALKGFSGRSGPNDFIDSYLDLSRFKGQSVSFRFRFGTNDAGTVQDETFPEDAGWFLDDIELIDLINNDSEACISTTDDSACTIEPMIFDPVLRSSTQNNTFEGLSFEVYPNPADNFVAIDIFSERNFDAQLSVISMDGKQVLSQKENINARQNLIQLNTSSLAPGFYIIQLLSENGLVSHKVLIQ